MVTLSKLALIASVAAVSVASQAFAQDAGPNVVYQLPSEMPGFGAQAAPRNDPVTAPDRRLYNSVVVPSHDWGDYSDSSAAARGNSH